MQPNTSNAQELLQQLAALQNQQRGPGQAQNPRPDLVAGMANPGQQFGQGAAFSDPNTALGQWWWNMLQNQRLSQTQQGGGGSLPLEQLLSSVSQQPELAAQIPSLLTQLQAQQQGGQGIPVSSPSTVRASEGGIEVVSGVTNNLMPFGAQGYSLAGGADGGLKEEGLKEEGGSEGQDGQGEGSGSLGARGGVKCAKEKNRQAQRRFRERQKGLITNLKDRADSLQKQVEEQRRQIETLEKENQVLKVILQEKTK